MIIHKRVKLRYASVYVPYVVPDGRSPEKERYSVGFLGTDNPDRPELPLRPSYKEPMTIRGYYYSTLRPTVTMMDYADYASLISLHDIFRVRNIPLDRMFMGATVDIALHEWHKADETVLQLQEVIIHSMGDLNIKGELIV